MIEFSCEAIQSWMFACWEFLITVSILLLVIGLFFFFLFLFASVLGNCPFLRIWSFLPGCPFYWHIVACNSLFMILCISVVFIVTSFLISNFTVLSPLFLRWSWLMGYQFYLFKEPAFSFIYLLYCFLHLCFIYFFSDLYDFFPSTNFGFCLLLFLWLL